LVQFDLNPATVAIIALMQIETVGFANEESVIKLVDFYCRGIGRRRKPVFLGISGTLHSVLSESVRFIRFGDLLNV